MGFRRCAVTLPGAGGAATLRRSGGRVALRRCDAAVGPVTLRRCWRCDAATQLALGELNDAATRERRCDAVGAATLRRFLLQECTRRCVAARHGNPH